MNSRWHNWSWYLLVILLLALIIAPVVRLAPVAWYWIIRPHLTSEGYTRMYSVYEVVGESEHFIVEAPWNYFEKRELANLLERAEAARARLIVFLHIPDDQTRVTVRINAVEGIPYTGTEDINLYAVKAGHTSWIHELTHYLMGYPNGLMAEGLAILTEERFGWGLSFPNMLRPVESNLYHFLRKDEPLVPLDKMRLTGRVFQRADPERSRLRYLQTASFAAYLSGRYGIGPYLQVYRSGDYQAAFGRSLPELEQDWLAWVRRGHLYQAALMTVFGLAVVELFQLAPRLGRRWRVPAWLGFLAFFIWDYNWFYPWLLPLILLAGVGLGYALRERAPRMAAVVPWLVAAAALAGFVVIPAL